MKGSIVALTCLLFVAVAVGLLVGSGGRKGPRTRSCGG